ncbi:protein of unknown function [Chitinophaga sp. YR627]|uniref:DUF4178 domain-containing protein n=1 Tax=Chitinophaga sp. YR627 TaxID=1881041 RepID=UPI0008E508C8|nr:DUF4178 domain-containing protein [Chitinophaga sp. YR627]SFN48457.1 protein of unknown function [Chitinophaga sp. YR627]
MTVIPSIYQCPSCSRVVNFTSPHTTIKVCECGTVINRMGDGTLLPRPFRTIADKASVIAPGTTGQWNGKKFTVTGRFRIWTEETVFSYWTIIFQDETAAYLAEGYGMYAIYIPKESPTELTGDNIRAISVGKKKLMFGEEYVLLRKDNAKLWEVEGELYMPECNTTFMTYDFSSSSGRIIHIIEYWPRVQPAFEVHHTDFTSLGLTNTRPYENSGKSFTCKCGYNNHVATFPFAQSTICTGCGNWYVYRNQLEFAKVGQGNTMPAQPAIKVGAKGIIKGIPYTVTGFMMKEERNTYQARWTEYALFNEKEGFAFLSVYDGHWIYLREQGKTPVPDTIGTDGFRYEGRDFDLYNDYSFKVICGKGEFPGNPFNDGHIKCWEFIAPPVMWAREQSPEEGIVWFRGTHIAAKDLKEAFKDAIDLPKQEGTGMLKPNGYINIKDMLKYSLVAILVLIVVHLATTSGSKQEVLIDKEIYFYDSSDIQTAVVGDVHLDKRSSNVMLTINAPVDNSWVEVEATLVNKKDGTEYSVSKGVEYYSGVSEGERWSEGSQDAKVYLNSIPRGDYTVQLSATREKISMPLRYYHVTAYYDVSNLHNLFICIGLLLIWPVFKYIFTYYSEKNRWSNSSYSRFNYESE